MRPVFRFTVPSFRQPTLESTPFNWVPDLKTGAKAKARKEKKGGNKQGKRENKENASQGQPTPKNGKSTIPKSLHGRNTRAAPSTPITAAEAEKRDRARLRCLKRNERCLENPKTRPIQKPKQPKKNAPLISFNIHRRENGTRRPPEWNGKTGMDGQR